MASGLFDTPSPTDDPRRAASEADRYRALPATVIPAIVLALLSPLALLHPWLVTVPLIGLIAGLIGWRAIASRPDDYTGRPLAIAATVVSGLLLLGGGVWQARVYAAELPQGFERIDYGMLQPLPGDPPYAIPDSARAIDGHDVLLKGYIYPGKQERGIVQFVLVRDQGDCCFGGNPKITDRVLVQLADPRGTVFTPRLCKVAGRFSVRPTGTTALEGGVFYHLENALLR
ncbi:MAG: hypothetical protein ACOYK7_03925 [Pirellulales bacterium]|jgi:hypothetical protein